MIKHFSVNGLGISIYFFIDVFTTFLFCISQAGPCGIREVKIS